MGGCGAGVEGRVPVDPPVRRDRCDRATRTGGAPPWCCRARRARCGRRRRFGVRLRPAPAKCLASRRGRRRGGRGPVVWCGSVHAAVSGVDDDPWGLQAYRQAPHTTHHITTHHRTTRLGRGGGQAYTGRHHTPRITTHHRTCLGRGGGQEGQDAGPARRVPDDRHAVGVAAIAADVSLPGWGGGCLVGE